ncbi:MAG: tetratricopeptide repeat protein, partial [Martelella sp.]
YRPAAWRLLDWYSDPGSRFYQEDDHVKLLTELLNSAAPDELYSIASRLKKAPDSVKAKISQVFDMQDAYRQAASTGNPVAMRELAKLLRDDGSVESEKSEAIDWLEKAAKAGDAEAMLMLAQAYAFGVGVEHSAEKAKEWLKAAASAGDETAANLFSGLESN